MSQENDNSDLQTEEVLTYTIDTIEYPCNVPSTGDMSWETIHLTENDTSLQCAKLSPTKPMKRKLNAKTGKMQRNENSPPLKTYVYCKSHYRQQMRSLFKLMHETCKLETRVLNAAGTNLPASEQSEVDCPQYFTVLGRRFQSFANVQ